MIVILSFPDASRDYWNGVTAGYRLSAVQFLIIELRGFIGERQIDAILCNLTKILLKFEI